MRGIILYKMDFTGSGHSIRALYLLNLEGLRISVRAVFGGTGGHCLRKQTQHRREHVSESKKLIIIVCTTRFRHCLLRVGLPY